MEVDATLCRPCLIRGKHVLAINYLETESCPYWPLCEKHSNVVRRSLYGVPKSLSLIQPETIAQLRMLKKENP